MTAKWACSLREDLAGLVTKPGAHADLRSGLRKAPTDCTRLHKYLWRHTKGAEPRDIAVYTVAALCGAHPELVSDRRDTKGTTVGEALAQASLAPTHPISKEGAFQRLMNLARQPQPGLAAQLVSLVPALLRAGALFDVAQLADDMASWPYNRARVTRRWINDYARTMARTQAESGSGTNEAELSSQPDGSPQLPTLVTGQEPSNGPSTR